MFPTQHSLTVPHPPPPPIAALCPGLPGSPHPPLFELTNPLPLLQGVLAFLWGRYLKPLPLVPLPPHFWRFRYGTQSILPLLL